MTKRMIGSDSNTMGDGGGDQNKGRGGKDFTWIKQLGNTLIAK